MYLYVVTDGEHIKIGISQNVESRLSTLQVGNTRKLHLSLTVDCGNVENAARLERLLHIRYAEFRESGEWFRMSATVVISDMKFVADAIWFMLKSVESERMRLIFLDAMSRTEIEAYIEQRWPTPKPIIAPEEFSERIHKMYLTYRQQHDTDKFTETSLHKSALLYLEKRTWHTGFGELFTPEDKVKLAKDLKALEGIYK